MHKLNRGPAPNCLTRYQQGRNHWRELTSADRRNIWQALDAMQAERCAYCEKELQNDRRHIEHFIQRNRKPQLTFDWTNLFGSCNQENTCGKHKDHLAGFYRDADVLKPDVDDPDDYLIFFHDGTIRPREDLNALQKQRAEETLRVFNLDAEHGALRQMRRQAVAGYLQIADTLWSLADQCSEEEWQQLLEAELAAIEHLPFVTTIRHTLSAVS